MSNNYDLMQSVQTTITNMNLSGLGSVAIKKLPKAEENLDVLPAVFIAPSEVGETIDYMCFGQQVTTIYTVDVVIISPGNRDLTQNNIATYMAWREAIKNAYQQLPIQNASTYLQNYCWRQEVITDGILDRSQLNRNYDYQPLSIRFSVTESSSAG